MEKYFILMGDVISSRKIDSEKLWDILNTVIDHAKVDYKDDIVSSLEIKIGDEFQVIMKDIDSLLSMLFYLDVYFRYKEVDCRFAIGYGTVTGNINKKSAKNMVGLGLTNTNELLNIKKHRYSFFIQDEIQKTILLNTIGLLLEDTLSNLTHKQKVYLYYKVIEKKTMEDLQIVMNVKQRNLYDYRQRSKYNLINEVFNQITNIFKFNEDNLIKDFYTEYKINIGENNE